MSPSTLQELADAAAQRNPIAAVGSGSKSAWRLPVDRAEEVFLGNLTGVIDFSPNDQVVNVRAGTQFSDLQRELAAHGQCLPMLDADPDNRLGLKRGTIGGELSLNLPHELEAECGSWRDWVLGMTLVLADGTIAKSGSHAVKSVAGYDIHKLMIGARGTLAIVGEVILRTYPIKSLPEPHLVKYDGEPGPCAWIQRVKPSDFRAAAEAASRFCGFDVPKTSTIFRWIGPDDRLPRYSGDWVLRSNSAKENLQITDTASLHYMERAKALLDPERKLSPGEMGVL